VRRLLTLSGSIEPLQADAERYACQAVAANPDETEGPFVRGIAFARTSRTGRQPAASGCLASQRGLP